MCVPEDIAVEHLPDAAQGVVGDILEKYASVSADTDGALIIRQVLIRTKGMQQFYPPGLWYMVSGKSTS